MTRNNRTRLAALAGPSFAYGPPFVLNQDTTCQFTGHLPPSVGAASRET